MDIHIGFICNSPQTGTYPHAHHQVPSRWPRKRVLTLKNRKASHCLLTGHFSGVFPTRLKYLKMFFLICFFKSIHMFDYSNLYFTIVKSSQNLLRILNPISTIEINKWNLLQMGLSNEFKSPVFWLSCFLWKTSSLFLFTHHHLFLLHVHPWFSFAQIGHALLFLLLQSK